MGAFRYQTLRAFEGNAKFMAKTRAAVPRAAVAVAEKTAEWTAMGWEVMLIQQTSEEEEDGLVWRVFSISVRKPI